MALLFWRKTRDHGSTEDFRETAVTEDNPLPVQFISNDENDQPLLVTVANDLRTIPIPYKSQSALTVDSTSTGIQLTIPTGETPCRAEVSVFGGPIRFWPDGKVPTSTTGHRANVYSVIILESYEEILNFKAIRESGVSATLETTFYRKAV